jgi:DNA-directed RNA polymerase subunit RPC12/RpoP
MFSICPECSNDKLKVKTIEKRIYDPATTRVTVNGDIDMVEYHCAACGWTVLLEDPPFIPADRAHELEEAQANQAAKVP